LATVCGKQGWKSMGFPFHSAQEKGMVYLKQILPETRGQRQRHDLTADVARSAAATALSQDVTKSKSLRCSFPKRCRATLVTAVQKVAVRGKRELVGKVERGLRVLVAVRQHLGLVLRTQPRYGRQGALQPLAALPQMHLPGHGSITQSQAHCFDRFGLCNFPPG